MWIFTKFGFITAVAARQGNGYRDYPVDTVIVRTRERSHMENLITRFHDKLGSYQIDEDTECRRDYKYLLFVPKTVWAEVLYELAMDIDYPKFKPSVIDFKGKEAYQETLLHVWHRMLLTQDR
jgi:hypothetical protein